MAIATSSSTSCRASSRISFADQFLCFPSDSQRLRSLSFCSHLHDFSVSLKISDVKKKGDSCKLSAVVRAERDAGMMEVDQSISPRVNSVKPSKTVAITDQATALVQAGVPVIRLAAGEPDFATPAVIAEAGINAIRDGHTKYSPNSGTLELRSAICHKLKEENGLLYTPEEILMVWKKTLWGVTGDIE